MHLLLSDQALVIMLVGCSFAATTHEAWVRGHGKLVLVLRLRSASHAAQSQGRIAILHEQGYIDQSVLTAQVVRVDRRVEVRWQTTRFLLL